MKVYIDNNEIDINYSKCKNISSIINDLSKKLKTKNRVVKNIYLNGTNIYNHNCFDYKKDNVLEIETESKANEIIFFINECKNNAQEFLDYFEQIIDKYENFGTNIKNYTRELEELLYMLLDISESILDATECDCEKRINKKLRDTCENINNFFIVCEVYYTLKKFDDLIFYIEAEVIKPVRNFIRYIDRYGEDLIKNFENNNIS